MARSKTDYQMLRDMSAVLEKWCDENMIDYISTLLENAELRRDLGEAGRQLVADKFTWPSVAARMTAVYQDVIARSPNLYSTETSLT